MNEIQKFNILIPKNNAEKPKGAETPPSSQPENATSENSDNDSQENGLTRRRFMQLGGATLASIALFGLKFGNETRGKVGKMPGDTNERKAIRDSYLEEKRKERRDKARHYIEVDDMEVIGKTFQEQIETQDYITLDQSTRNAIRHNWKEKYAHGTVNYNDGIVQGLERMRPWASEIKKIFKQHNVPEEYIYLAIAESHFSSENISRAGAVGPYQITKDTAQLEEFEIIVNSAYDERLDPLKSAELCAKHLRYSYERFGDSWDFAVLAYNGGFTEDFLRSLPDKEKQMPQDQISSQGAYMLKKGDTLSDIVDSKGTSLTLLWKKNALTEEERDMENGFSKWVARMKKASEGEILDIPQKRKIDLEDFHHWLEGEINKKIKAELSSDKYKVEGGDDFGKIAKKFQMDLSLLKSLNHDVPDKLLRVGQNLHIPAIYKKKSDVLKNALSKFSENINYPGKFDAIWEIIQENHLDSILDSSQKSFLEISLERNYTLKDVSKYNGIAINDLLELNPAIKSFDLKLPVGFKVRVPNQYLIAKSESTRKN